MKQRRRRQLAQNVGGTTYRDETDPRVVEILENARGRGNIAWRATGVSSGDRLCIRYGDQDTGRDWGDPPMCGTIGRSAGTQKVPLLIKSKRSTGGEAILDHKIIRITRGAKPKDGRNYVLYQHSKYHYPEGERAEQIEQIAKDAEIEARQAARAGNPERAADLRRKAKEIRKQRFSGRRRK